MKKAFLVVLLSGAVQSVLADSDPAKVETETAWLAFSNARGEASLIRGDLSHPSANAVFRVIPEVGTESLDDAKLELGFNLFHDGRLSRDGTVSCASCHISLMGGVDHRPVPFGVGGAQGTMNAPTIFNAALNFRQFWDGRALTLQEQALGPIQNAVEFDHALEDVVAVLEGIPEYVEAFELLYPDHITATNLSDAIAYYETMNFTGLSSPFLRQFDGAADTLNRQARRGQQRFVEVGCASCHNGVNLGGNSFQPLGVAKPWYGEGQAAAEADNGLLGRTGRARDRHVFKVPTLHNVANTGPWLHDGSIASLQQVVDRMARFQSGRYLDNSDIDDIVAFLRSLGDPLAMLGDCTATGTYGVTMDCSTSQRSADDTQGEPVRPQLPAPAALAEQHRKAYAEALDRVAKAPARIMREMQRIRSGEVAHYDFLQYEHIEMLRHARALSYPPANLERPQHDALIAQADELQRSAGEYELIITDFLRAYASASNARTNLQDLVRLMSRDADEPTQSLLTQTEQGALRYFAEPGPATQLAFESAARVLNEAALNSQLLEELQLQVRMLLENIPRLPV